MFEPCSGIKKYLQVKLNFPNESHKEKQVVVGLELNQILTLKFQFKKLCSIMIYIFTKGSLSY